MAGEVGRAIGPHLGEEDFVTAALAQIAPTGELTIVNCGHHPPLLRHRGDLQPLTDGKAALPLGLEDDFTAFTATWSPGDRLLLYTDGLVESRDAHGHFLPEDAIATALLAPDCDQALDTLMRAVDRHTGGHAHDDMALLLLEHGASARSSANGHTSRRPCRCRALNQTSLDPVRLNSAAQRRISFSIWLLGRSRAGIASDGLGVHLATRADLDAPSSEAIFGADASTRNGWPATAPEAVGQGTSSSGCKLLIPSTPTSDFRTGWWQADWRGGVVRPVRYLGRARRLPFREARATWQRFRVNRTTLRGQRSTAWRRSGSALLYIGGAVFLLVIILKLSR